MNKTPILSSSTLPLPELTIFKELGLINTIPNELLLEIFKKLNLQVMSSSRLVCHHWRNLANDLKTIYGQYFNEINSIQKLFFLAPESSPWTAMPRHWALNNKENVLKFSSVVRDKIAFHPPFFNQSSKFFSFGEHEPFSDRHIFLSHYGDTDFLTPQEKKPNLILDSSPEYLKPNACHQLVAINRKDPTKNREFSLLGDLPPTEANLSKCQIEYCFPITENHIVIITAIGQVSFWDLSTKLPQCYKVLEIESGSKVYQLENHLVLDKEIIDLKTFSLIEHGFKFANQHIQVYGSSMCTYGRDEVIRYFVVNKMGLLELKWEFRDKDLLKVLSNKGLDALNLAITDMNESFILITCWQPHAISFLIINVNGKLVHHSQENIKEKLYHSCLYMFPTCAGLCGNILIYKNPQGNEIRFWHIPTKKFRDFDWTKSIGIRGLTSGMTFIQDVCFKEEKLTILFSSDHTPNSNKSGKFQLIQFDPQKNVNTPPLSWMGMIVGIISNLKNMYLGKKNT